MMYTMTKTTPQKSIGSGSGAATTAAEVIRGIDLSGKTAIVTGGYSGIGLQTTRTLLSAGARSSSLSEISPKQRPRWQPCRA